MNLGKKDIIIYLILFFLIYKTCFVSEKMANVSQTDIENAVKNVYKTDVEAIRNLSNLATDLTKNGKLIIKGGLEIEGPLTVDGNTKLKKTLDVTGAASLENTLNVTGVASLENTLNVTGEANLKNKLNVTGAASLENTLNVTNKTTLQESLKVNSSLNVNNKILIEGSSIYFKDAYFSIRKGHRLYIDDVILKYWKYDNKEVKLMND